MTFEIFEDWEAPPVLVVVHVSGCPYAEATAAAHGRWLGPFETYADAYDCIDDYTDPSDAWDAAECVVCRPGASVSPA